MASINEQSADRILGTAVFYRIARLPPRPYRICASSVTSILKSNRDLAWDKRDPPGSARVVIVAHFNLHAETHTAPAQDCKLVSSFRPILMLLCRRRDTD